MTTQKKLLKWTVFLVALLQIPSLALTPAVNRIYSDVFTSVPLSAIQTSISVSGMVSPFSSILMSFLIRRGAISKRAVVVIGLLLLGSSGPLAVLLHGRFACIAILSSLIGFAAGCYISTTTSIMMDIFDSAECRRLAGGQSICIGLGGALLSISSGFLINYLWYGGYIVLSIGLPVGIFALFSLPRGNAPEYKKASAQKKKAKLDPDVYFYAAAIAMLLFLFSVGTGNLSVHLAAAGIKNFSVAAGFGSAVQMLGSAVFGFFFTPLSKRFGDYLIPAAFLMITLGLLILSLCTFSLILMFLGIAIIGMSMSTLNPQCVLSVSKRVNVYTSAMGTSLINSVAPGIGTFLSPVIITNVTFSLAGDNTIFRYCFTAFLSLATAATFFFLCRYRAKKKTDADI